MKNLQKEHRGLVYWEYPSPNSSPKQSAAFALLHGFMGDHRDWPGPVITALQEWGPVFAFDLPGHGRTPLDESNNSYEKLAALLFSWQQGQQGQQTPPVVFLGYSMGGRLAYATACLKGGAMALILESSAPPLGPGEAKAQRRQEDQQLLKSVLQGQESFASFLQRWYQRPLFGPLADCAEFKGLLQRRLEQSPQQLQDAISIFGPGTLPSGQHPPDCPLLYLAGEKDRKYAALAKQWQTFHPGAVTSILPGLGHNLHAQAPIAFTQNLRVFLRQQLHP